MYGRRLRPRVAARRPAPGPGPAACPRRVRPQGLGGVSRVSHRSEVGTLRSRPLPLALLP